MAKKGKKLVLEQHFRADEVTQETVQHTNMHNIEQKLLSDNSKSNNIVKVIEDKKDDIEGQASSECLILKNTKINTVGEINDLSTEQKTVVNNNEATVDDDNTAKMSKKQLKRQRQKERKKSEKDGKENAKDIVEPCATELKDIATVKSSLEVQSKNDNITKDNDMLKTEEINRSKEDNTIEDFTFDNDSMPAFVSTALKKNSKKQSSTKPDEINKKVSLVQNKSSVNTEHTSIKDNYDDHVGADSNNFTLVKGKRTKLISNSNGQLPESSVNEAVQLILRNKISEAITHLSAAIQQNPSQVQHYVNRGFCYLRLAEHALAIKDVQHAIQNSNDISILLRATYILAQAFCEIKNYEEAEKYFKECLSLAPQNTYFQRELLRIRVLQLISFGFPITDAIYAIKKTSSISDAIELLSENCSSNGGNNVNAQNTCIHDENEVYYSDDEDNNSSHTLLLSSL